MTFGQNFIDPSRVQKLNRLVEVSLVMNSTLELEPLLRFIMDAAAELTDSHSASILLVDPKTKELHFMAFNSESESDSVGTTLRRIPVPLKGSVAGAVVAGGSSDCDQRCHPGPAPLTA
ncbi:MAG: hypothetical protein HC915_06715, partial [Anaerolineae bacterium]|nr:hypothetical protein [Anaerolineae bacterium]